MPLRPIFPFWLRQRQIQAELLNEHTLKLQGPNLPPCELRIEAEEDGQHWRAVLVRVNGEARMIAAARAAEDHPQSAWQLGFELYRKHVVN
ncbi:MAG: hypothetical protein RMJ19_01325 [Gemmatales bacterium]|nr:hypothetical protein [Gemmatales bacterium]MCS7159087.1 hypothetical protein [Gemmatales bacterium]MDW8174287.1 hypothetical protein [Gemmatales bacterium]MDW8221992.1 hypothetical protein [Gemmatales bacterium]